MKMRVPDALRCLLALLFLWMAMVRASGPQRSRAANATVPSAATLAACPKGCGDLRFEYPFGVGAGCFRQPDFELICDHHDKTMPPRLFLHDGTTEVIADIVAPGFGSYNHYQDVDIHFSHVITLKSGLVEYTMPWKAPGRSFSLDTAYFNITGCDFDIYQLNRDLNASVRLCTVSCPNEQITDLMARESCNGTGCCSIMLGDSDFELKFVRHRVEKDQPQRRNRSTLWDRINVTSLSFGLTWTIADESSCSAALDNMTNYACVSSHSVCMPNNLRSIIGYMCACDAGYAGNAYITDGCYRDNGYNPVQQKANCTQNCGNINVPFPFGLEEGCFARESFHLNCTNMTSSTLQFGYAGREEEYITYVNISKGHVGLKYTSNGEQLFVRNLIDNEPNLYGGLGESATVQWAVANLTCQEAYLNSSGYACVSVNSICLGVNSTNEYTNVYIGYRCICKNGFQGNPYIRSGCEGGSGRNGAPRTRDHGTSPWQFSRRVNGAVSIAPIISDVGTTDVGRRLSSQLLAIPNLIGEASWTGHRLIIVTHSFFCRQQALSFVCFS